MMNMVRRRWGRGLGVLMIVAALAVGGVRATHETALAQKPSQVQAIPARGCPTGAPKNFSGILVSTPQLGVLPSQGFGTDTFPVLSFQFGVARAISSPTGASGHRVASAPKLSEITLTRLSDRNDPIFFEQSLLGRASTWTVTIFKSVDHNGQPACLGFKLENTLVSSFSVSSGGDRPSESISLNFTKITMSHTDGPSVTWDTTTQPVT